MRRSGTVSQSEKFRAAEISATKNAERRSDWQLANSKSTPLCAKAVKASIPYRAAHKARLRPEFVAEGGDQALRLNDNTGEKYVKGKSPKLAVDGIRITVGLDVDVDLLHKWTYSYREVTGIVTCESVVNSQIQCPRSRSNKCCGPRSDQKEAR